MRQSCHHGGATCRHRLTLRSPRTFIGTRALCRQAFPEALGRGEDWAEAIRGFPSSHQRQKTASSCQGGTARKGGDKRLGPGRRQSKATPNPRVLLCSPMLLGCSRPSWCVVQHRRRRRRLPGAGPEGCALLGHLLPRLGQQAVRAPAGGKKGSNWQGAAAPFAPGLLPASRQHAGSRSILTAVQTPARGANNPAAALQRELTHSWVLQGTKKPRSSRKEHSEPGSVLQHRAGEESEVQSPPWSVPRTKPAETRGRKASRHRRAQGIPDGPAGDAQQQSRAAQSLSPLPGLKQNAAQPAAGFLQVEEHSCCWGRKQQGLTTAANPA